MTFSGFLDEVKKLKREELRVQEPEYLEVVISKEDLAPLHKVLSGYFGSPLKPGGCAPSGEAKRCAAPYGGIRNDQTMYYRREKDICECALLWPWGSGNRITIKIIQDKGTDPEPAFGVSAFFARLFGHN